MSVNAVIDKEILNDGDVNKEDEELIFNPYNPNNIEITEQQVCDILKKYGVPSKVHNINLYKRAFIHKSYCKRPKIENDENGIIIVEKPGDCMKLKTKSNERLEFLGDGVLECITKYYLYRRFPKANEGFMTEKKIALVKNESIGKMVYEMGLNKWYIMSANAEEKKTRTNLKKLGCLFEAFLGALFLDFNKIDIRDEDNWFKDTFVTGPGFQIAQIFVESIFDHHVDWLELLKTDDNYKNRLQVVLQKAFKVTPVYMEISEWDEETGYHMGVFLCMGQKHHYLTKNDAISMGEINNTTTEVISPVDKIQYYLENVNEKILLFLGESKHKIKKKAEQSACKTGYELITTSAL
tara:strand:+ start:8987 stop:10042 length:1056 start_codon:yes stop_codon:yes gene_type:complete